jgi:hypothetical protein
LTASLRHASQVDGVGQLVERIEVPSFGKARSISAIVMRTIAGCQRDRCAPERAAIAAALNRLFAGLGPACSKS